MIGSAVFAQLSTLVGSQLTSPNGTKRIYSNYQSIADKQYPAIVYECENYQPDDCMDGSDGVPTIDVKLYVVSGSYDQADDLGRQVATALHGTAGTWGPTIVLGCFVEEVAESSFVDTDMETILYYEKEITCKVTYRE